MRWLVCGGRPEFYSKGFCIPSSSTVAHRREQILQLGHLTPNTNNKTDSRTPNRIPSLWYDPDCIYGKQERKSEDLNLAGFASKTSKASNFKEEAFNIWDQIPAQISVEDFVSILQKCRKSKRLADAKHMHVSVCSNSVEAHGPVGNHIVPMFAECGSTSDTQQSFNSLIYRNEHSWTSLISAFVECGQPQHAFGLYSTMKDDGVHPSSYTLVVLLRACAKLKDLENGQNVHVEVTKQGLEGNPYVGCTLIDMYAKCGSLDDAQKAFHKLSVKNVITWNALIAGYVDNGRYQEALECYEQMQIEGVPGDAVSFVCGLKACGSVGAIDKGLAMHIEIVQRGFGNDPYVGNTLVDMYAKCGLLAEARIAFEKLLTRDVVSWNTLIGGCVENGQGLEALKYFEKMRLEGVFPSSITYVCVLKACGV